MAQDEQGDGSPSVAPNEQNREMAGDGLAGLLGSAAADPLGQNLLSPPSEDPLDAAGHRDSLDRPGGHEHSLLGDFPELHTPVDDLPDPPADAPVDPDQPDAYDQDQQHYGVADL
jgi:hypothetical protein